MRTTLVIDDDILKVARAQAQAAGKSIGQILSALARRGLNSGIAHVDTGLPVFQVSENAPVLGPNEVALGEDEP